jgi:hypothetical protein
MIQDLGDYPCHHIGRRTARCPNSTSGARSVCRSTPLHFVLSDVGVASYCYFMVRLRELYLTTVPGSA